MDAPTVAALLARVQARWVRFGQERPHWSTDARPEFLPENIEANRAEFEATGEGEVATLLAMLARYGYAPRSCRAGLRFRLRSRPYDPAAGQACSQQVTGCDVSPPHLTLARAASGAERSFAW